MIELITDAASHKRALARVEELWDAKPGSSEQHEFDALATLIDAYEQRAFPIEDLGPIEAIKIRCEELGWSRRQLEPLMGSRARVSEVLSGKRSLTLPIIRRLHAALKIPTDILVVEPALPKRRSRKTKARRRQARVQP